MNKILLIIQREYLTRVRKKSFIVMSILGPLLIAGFYGIIIWSTLSAGEDKSIQVLDKSGLFTGKFESNKKIAFVDTQGDLTQVKQQFAENGIFDALLYIPELDLENPKGVQIFSEEGISAVTKERIERIIENEIESQRLNKLAGIDKETLRAIEARINIETISMSEKEEKSTNTKTSSVVGLVCGIIIYFFVFLYGAMVMRSVMEEKTSRIVEIIISSVKPFQLMMGKIVGVAGVGLTQLLIWVVLGFAVTTIGASFMNVDTEQIVAASKEMQENSASMGGTPQQMNFSDNELVKGFSTINFPLIIGAFIFYFLFGYLMYASLFGAIGAAVDSETETQQFMLPISLPLILSISLSTAIITDPNGQLAFWLSIFPLTSPVAMMIRLPFIGVSWQLFLSMFVLIGAFVGTTWLAGRIYRVGILMYGKKVTYKELGKWLFYKF